MDGCQLPPAWFFHLLFAHWSKDALVIWTRIPEPTPNSTTLFTGREIEAQRGKILHKFRHWLFELLPQCSFSTLPCFWYNWLILVPLHLSDIFITKEVAPGTWWDGIFRNLKLQAQTFAISSSDFILGERTLAKVSERKKQTNRNSSKYTEQTSGCQRGGVEGDKQNGWWEAASYK